jgi:hypothetical protein
MTWVGDSIGVATIAAIIGALAYFVPSSEVTYPVWWAAFAGLSAVGIFFWRQKDSPRRPTAWLRVLGIVCLMDAASFCVDIIGGHFIRPQLSLIQAAVHFGGPLGFAATSVLIPAVFIAATAGLVRSAFLSSVGNA